MRRVRVLGGAAGIVLALATIPAADALGAAPRPLGREVRRWLSVAAAACVSSLVAGSGRPVRDLGLLPRPDDATAVVAALVVAAAVSVPIALGLERLPRRPVATAVPTGPPGTGAARVADAVHAAVTEEVVFRGLLQGALAAELPPAFAVAVQALLFGLLHAGPPAAFDAGRLVEAGTVGLVLGVLAHRRGATGPGVVVHACLNVAAAAQRR